MIDYGRQRSTVQPEPVEILEKKVLVATNITPVSEPETEEMPSFTGYEFNLVEYGKDEYIRKQAESNADLEKQMTETQLALCDVYEMIN